MATITQTPQTQKRKFTFGSWILLVSVIVIVAFKAYVTIFADNGNRAYTLTESICFFILFAGCAGANLYWYNKKVRKENDNKIPKVLTLGIIISLSLMAICFLIDAVC